MNYCSINEAWNTNNYISNQFKKHNTPYQNENREIEYFENENKNENENENKNNYSIKELTCRDFLNHLMGCSKCQRKLKNKMQNKVIEKFTTLIDDNRDIIVMILAGISIVLFFNLINNLSK